MKTSTTQNTKRIAKKLVLKKESFLKVKTGVKAGNSLRCPFEGAE